MTKTSRRSLAKTIVRLLHEQPGQRQHVLQSLAAYLITNRQIRQLDLFMKDLARELQVSEKALVAEVQSAYPLNEAARTQLKEYLRRETDTTEVELEEVVAADLLSGIIVRTADREIDLSARHQLQRLVSLNSGGNS